jgi:glycosyltransferase involved in cell wall biosynthesis
MRILHLYKDYYPVMGGIENHVRLLAEGQARAGDEVAVLVTNPGLRGTREHLGGVDVTKVGRLAKVASTPLSLRFASELTRRRPDITHVHSPYPPAEVLQYLLGRSHATVLTYHSDVIRQRRLARLYRPLMRRVLGRVDRILVSSPAHLASQLLVEYRSKCRVVPFGIRLDRFETADPGRVAALRAMAEGRISLLFVGVFRYYKGLQYLIEAMADVEALLVLVGSGPLEGELRQRVAELGLDERVRFAGRVSDQDLPAYYQAANLFVLPSCEPSETFGIAQLEALAAGLPVVGTELGTGTTFVNRHEETGLVVPPKDSKALSAAINRLLGDEALRRRLSEGARRRAQLFDAERMLAEVERIYEQVLEGSR